MNTKLPNTLIHKAIKEFGTPLYVYQRDSFEKKFRDLSLALKDIDHTICYAVKANSNLTILNRLARLGSGFDIVSGGELHRVRAAGGDLSKVVFAGVGKTKEEIELGLASNIRFFNVESIDELLRIESIAESMHCTAPVSFRVNPNISVDTHPYLATGIDKSKFGIPKDDIYNVYELVKNSKFVNVIGVDCHIGSQISDISAYETALMQLISLADGLTQKGAKINTIDLGGGMAISFSGKYEPIDISAYGQMVTKHLKEKPYSFIVEPGKFLISECGFLITEVLYTKKNNNNEFIITDAGMNDLMRPSLYQAYHKMDILDKESAPATHKYHVGGPVCESGCMFTNDLELPEVKAGDYLTIHDAGGYGFSMSSNYNTRPRAAEIIIENQDYQLIRKRESARDLFALEELESLKM